MIDIETIAKLEIEEGDVLVVNSPRPLRTEQRNHIHGACTALLERIGKRAQVVVLEDGMKMEVLKTSQLPDVKEAS